MSCRFRHGFRGRNPSAHLETSIQLCRSGETVSVGSATWASQFGRGPWFAGQGVLRETYSMFGGLHG